MKYFSVAMFCVFLVLAFPFAGPYRLIKGKWPTWYGIAQ